MIWEIVIKENVIKEIIIKEKIIKTNAGEGVINVLFFLGGGEERKIARPDGRVGRAK